MHSPLKPVTVACLLLLCRAARADLLYYEPFNYSPGEDALKGAGLFTNEANAGASGDILSNTLSYRDALGNALRVSGNHAFIDTGEEAAQVENTGSISLAHPDPEHAGVNVRWFSLIGQQTAGTNARFIGLSFRAPDNTYLPADGGSQVDEILNIGFNSVQSPIGWRIADRSLTNGGLSATSTTSPYVQAFLVVKLELNIDGGSLERFTLWVNPPLNQEPAPESGFTFTSPNSDINQWSDINQIRLAAGFQNASGPSSSWLVDEIRIGETWADVTPFEPAFEVDAVTLLPDQSLKLSWQTSPGRVDTVEWSLDGVVWNPISASTRIGGALPETAEFTVAKPGAATGGYFARVRRVVD